MNSSLPGPEPGASPLAPASSSPEDGGRTHSCVRCAQMGEICPASVLFPIRTVRWAQMESCETVPDVQSLGSVQACIGTCNVVHCGPGLHLCISFCGDMEGFSFLSTALCAFVSLRLLA